jgi:hypothetical protein
MWRVLTPISVAIVALACIVIGSTVALSNVAVVTGAPAYVTKADFDRAFADAAAGMRDSKPTIREKFRDASWNFYKASH